MAINTTLKAVALPSPTIREETCPTIKLHAVGDNEAVVHIFKTGRSPPMRQFGQNSWGCGNMIACSLQVGRWVVRICERGRSRIRQSLRKGVYMAPQYVGNARTLINVLTTVSDDYHSIPPNNSTHSPIVGVVADTLMRGRVEPNAQLWGCQYCVWPHYHRLLFPGRELQWASATRADCIRQLMPSPHI